jgi:hypothetical protein
MHCDKELFWSIHNMSKKSVKVEHNLIMDWYNYIWHRRIAALLAWGMPIPTMEVNWWWVLESTFQACWSHNHSFKTLLLEQESNGVWDGIPGVNYHWMETTLNSKYTQDQYEQRSNLIGYI